MLSALSVSNLVVVRALDIEFERGLTVLSGETGAGKSIIVEALGLALGERADLGLLRAGAERASVSARFDLADAPAARAFLREHALDDGDDCVLRRVLGRDGRTRAFVNASPVPLPVLRALGELLVEVHAQHAGVRLLARERQRELLDAYGGHAAELAAVQAACAEWQAAAAALAAAEQAGLNAERLALLRYQVDELGAADIDAAGLVALGDEHRRLAHAAGNLEHCVALHEALAGGEGGALDSLRAAAGRARLLVRHAPEAQSLLDGLEQALVCAEEAVRELARFEQSVEVDPTRLARLDQRLAEMHALARKHQVGMPELPELYARLRAELESFDRYEQTQAGLRKALDAADARYDAAAGALGAARRTAAARMHEDIDERLRGLGLVHARFTVSLLGSGEGTPQPHGRERVEFLLSTNPDQPAGPLAKVASGGELSRVALAIQAASAGRAGVPAVVYDEVDSGVGGTTANIVGRRLREVAQHCQVICITHSPQVASAGDQHLRVSKQVTDGATETAVEALSGRAREEEIARMLGAGAATRPSLAHARDLMAAAQRA